MRLFLAFEIPEQVRARIGERTVPLRSALPAARWVPPERLHLTIAFLGEVEEGRLAAIGDAVGPELACSPRLRLRLDGAGGFPPGRPARVAWIGVTGDPVRGRRPIAAGAAADHQPGAGALAAIEGRVRRALAPVLESPLEERPYHAHVTVARPRRPWGRDAVAAFESACRELADEWEAARAVLMESRLGHDGARYSVCQEYPLDTETGGPTP